MHSMPANATTLKMEDGSTLVVRDEMEVRCEEHGVVTTWGELDWVGRAAIEEGIDTMPDMPCLLLSGKQQS